MTMISVSDAASILCISERAVQKQAEVGKIESSYTSGKGRGGHQLRILLESLPQEAQEKYSQSKKKRPAPPVIELDQLPEAQRIETLRKKEAADLYLGFKEANPGMYVQEAFLHRYNAEHDKPITATQLQRWCRDYLRFGVSGLVDRRGRPNKGSTTLTKDMQRIFKGFYLKDSKPSIAKCREFTALALGMELN